MLFQEAKAQLGQGDSLENILDRVFGQHNLDHTTRIFLTAEIHCRIEGTYPEPPHIPTNQSELMDELHACASVLFHFHDEDVKDAAPDAARRACRYFQVPLSNRGVTVKALCSRMGKAGGHQRPIIARKRARAATEITLPI